MTSFDTVLTHDAESVGVIDEEPGAVLVLDLTDLRQRGQVTGHPVDTLGHHQDTTIRVMLPDPAQPIIEVCHIVMLEDLAFSPAKECSVVDGSVTQRIDDDRVTFTDQGCNDTEHTHVTVIPEHCGFLAHVLGEPLFERDVLGGVAGEHPGTHRTAGAVFIEGLLDRSPDLLVAGQPQVAVEGPDEYGLAAENHMRTGWTLQDRLGEVVVTLDAEGAEIPSVLFTLGEYIRNG